MPELKRKKQNKDNALLLKRVLSWKDIQNKQGTVNSRQKTAKGIKKIKLFFKNIFSIKKIESSECHSELDSESRFRVKPGMTIFILCQKNFF